ncbi:VRR-NUC domain-containing protein [Clostridium sp.]|uniref:VRR-NUC domain-containing protein n=1 Tax=Clostridium sp. TaxID=1506 RepID=UPI001A452DD7|nr:VRR-NUC domain-containing protein [Clostridium sp.]MBK5243195.1 VRR-NUC domain-containing protein [Clostridium sp.]
MLESRIEKRLKDEVEKIGGKSLKFVSPGSSGEPDRIVLLPGGKIIFVELKAPGEKLKPLQIFRAKELRNLGFDVRCIDSVKKIKELIEEVVI